MGIFFGGAKISNIFLGGADIFEGERARDYI